MSGGGNAISEVVFRCKDLHEFGHSVNGERVYVGLISVADLPDNPITHANLRGFDKRRKTHASVVESTKFDPYHHLKARGIKVTANSAKKDGHHLIVGISNNPEDKQGIGDGQGLYQAALTARKALTEGKAKGLKNQMLEIRFVVGDNKILPVDIKAKINDALNTGFNVQEFSRQHYLGWYDFIIEALEGTPWDGYFKFQEGGKGCEHVEMLLKYMELLNGYKYPTFRECPSGLDSDPVVKNGFKDNHEEYEQFKNRIVDILTLSEYVSFRSQKLLTDAHGYTADLRENEMFKRVFPSRRAKLYPDSPVRLETNFHMMILQTFRFLLTLDEEKQEMVWRVPFDDVIACAAEILPDLLVKIRSRNTAETDPESFAKGLHAAAKETKAKNQRPSDINWQNLSRIARTRMNAFFQELN